MEAAHRRHDISYELWELMEPHLLGREGTRGVRDKDNRLFINAVFWILRTGAPWRDLPPDYVVFVVGGTKVFGKNFLKFL